MSFWLTKMLFSIFRWNSMNNSVYKNILQAIVSTFELYRVPNCNLPTSKNKNTYCLGCNSKHFILEFALLELWTPQTMRHSFDISIAGRKYLCMSREVVLWPIHWDIRICVPMSYLRNRNHKYSPSRRLIEATGGHGRPPGDQRVLARAHKCKPLLISPGHLKLRLFGEQNFKYTYN